MSWQGELKIMEERLRLQMSSAARPYDTRTSLKCMAILSAFGLCAAACYPLLWVSGLSENFCFFHHLSSFVHFFYPTMTEVWVFDIACRWLDQHVRSTHVSDWILLGILRETHRWRNSRQVGMVVIAFSKSSQLYAAPLVVLAALGTVYGSSMLMIYYVNWRFHVPLADMAMALGIAMICLTLVTVAERHYESTKEKQTEALSRRLRQLLAYFKYTVTPVATGRNWKFLVFFSKCAPSRLMF